VSNNRIYVVEWNRRGFDAQNITASAGPNEDPDWSPDGRWITFESWRQNNHDIWIMTANGGQPVAVTSDPAWDYQPAWRP
jgi:Tol biopolymer transport system component